MDQKNIALGIFLAIFIPTIFTLIIHLAVYNKIKKKDETLTTYKLDLFPTYKPTISDILALK